MINTIAAWATIFSGFGLPLIAFAVWMMRRLFRALIREVSDLANNALQLARATDARMTRVESKLDDFILSRFTR